MNDLATQFGPIDIYLFDQLLRGRLSPPMRVLDAGCGSGRNAYFLMSAGFDVHAIDGDANAVAATRALAARLAPALSDANFRVEPVEAMSLGDHSVDAIVSIAVLHFARDDAHFEAMLRSMWRVLRPGGLFFCRLASDIGMEARMTPTTPGRYRMPDGSERYLVNEAALLGWTRRLGGTLLDPLKTTVVQDQRCMTTWVVRKG
ncbi:MAG: class I SAM-dependent methyltransferase [Candidatus Eisenbacteria bacterium]